MFILFNIESAFLVNEYPVYDAWEDWRRDR